MLKSPLKVPFDFTSNTVILFLFINVNASGTRVFSSTNLGFFVTKSFAFTFFKFLYFFAALAVSPSVIIYTFFYFSSLTITHPNRFEAITDNTFENLAFKFKYGI